MSQYKETTNFTSREGFKQSLNSVPYTKAYGSDISAILKPFTTNLTKSSGIPAYEIPVHSLFGKSVVPTGYVSLAVSTGLNPYGPNTEYEGLIHGTGLGSNMEININANDVRAFGFKNPMHLVGFGFDQFGYPAPNYNSGYMISGLLHNSTPSSGYFGSGSSIVAMGRDVPMENWHAGPCDMRWDIHRKVWTGAQSTYAAKITYAYYISGGTVLASGTSLDTSYFADYLHYNALITDGYASQILLTGLKLSGPQPELETYKVRPLSSGQTVLIVHEPGPRYGIFCWHNPSTTNCSNTPESFSSQEVGGGGGGDLIDIIGSSDVLTGDALFTTLGNDPLPVMYGGCGFSGYLEMDMLVGRGPYGTGSLGKYQIVVGTGLQINVNLAYETGLITFALASGVSFSTNGVNNDITELAALTTPLTIAQGGTGFSVKSFVDLTTSQSISGIKSFVNPLRIARGSVSQPGIAFGDYSSYGLALTTGIGGHNYVYASVSGVKKVSITPTGLISEVPLIFSSGALAAAAIPGAIEFEGTRFTATPNSTIGRSNVALLGNYTVSSISSDQNEITLPEGTNVAKISSTGQFQIHGISLNNPGGATITLINTGTNPLTFTHLNTLASSANRIKLPFDLPMVLRPGDCWMLTYDTTNNYWILLNGYTGYLHDTRYTQLYLEDFYSTHSNVYTVATAGTAAVSANVTGIIPSFGVLRNRVIASGDMAVVRSTSTLFPGDNMIFETRVNFSATGTATNLYRFGIGIATQATQDVTPNDSIMFVYAPNTNTWITRTSDGGSATQVSGIMQVGLNAHLKFVYNRLASGSGLVNFYVNGSGISTHSGNIPTDARNLQWCIVARKYLGSANNDILTDFIKMHRLGITARY